MRRLQCRIRSFERFRNLKFGCLRDRVKITWDLEWLLIVDRFRFLFLFVLWRWVICFDVRYRSCLLSRSKLYSQNKTPFWVLWIPRPSVSVRGSYLSVRGSYFDGGSLFTVTSGPNKNFFQSFWTLTFVTGIFEIFGSSTLPPFFAGFAAIQPSPPPLAIFTFYALK